MHCSALDIYLTLYPLLRLACYDVKAAVVIILTAHRTPSPTTPRPRVNVPPTSNLLYFLCKDVGKLAADDASNSYGQMLILSEMACRRQELHGQSWASSFISSQGQLPTLSGFELHKCQSQTWKAWAPVPVHAIISSPQSVNPPMSAYTRSNIACGFLT